MYITQATQGKLTSAMARPLGRLLSWNRLGWAISKHALLLANQILVFGWKELFDWIRVVLTVQSKCEFVITAHP